VAVPGFTSIIPPLGWKVTGTGDNTVLTDIATRMEEACWCETKSPMGGCCMSTVSKYIKAAKAKAGQGGAPDEKEEFTDCCSGHDETAEAKEDCCRVSAEAATDSGRKLGILAVVGAVFTAVLSSACCWLPLLLIAFGASVAGVAGFFEAYRFWFLGTTGVLLALGFYLVYFRKEKCAPDSPCATPGPKLQRFNKIMLWCATIMVALFSFFPNYIGVIQGNANAGEIIPDNLDQTSMSIEGMTCESCATSLQANLSKVDGVSFAGVDYESASALIGVPKGGKIPEQSLLKAVEEAGYKAKFQNPATKTLNISIKGMSCESCSTGISSALKELDGISMVRIDFSRKSGTISYLPAKANERKIIETIEKSGYEASAIKNPGQSSSTKSCCEAKPPKSK